MKLIINSYEPKEVFKLTRELSGLTQEQLALKLNRRSRHGIKNIEMGKTRFYFETLLEVSKLAKSSIILEKKNKMKLDTNDYELKEIFKILREWTDLTQEQLAHELQKKSCHGIKKYETGENRYYFDTIQNICNNHDINIIIKKD